jgi:hypothetical protein
MSNADVGASTAARNATLSSSTTAGHSCTAWRAWIAGANSSTQSATVLPSRLVRVRRCVRSLCAASR